MNFYSPFPPFFFPPFPPFFTTPAPGSSPPLIIVIISRDFPRLSRIPDKENSSGAARAPVSGRKSKFNSKLKQEENGAIWSLPSRVWDREFGPGIFPVPVKFPAGAAGEARGGSKPCRGFGSPLKFNLFPAQIEFSAFPGAVGIPVLVLVFFGMEPPRECFLLLLPV